VANEPTDFTKQVLIQIRDSIATLNERFDQTNARLDHSLKLAGEAARDDENSLRDHPRGPATAMMR
jgi:hypothetical protein